MHWTSFAILFTMASAIPVKVRKHVYQPFNTDAVPRTPSRLVLELKESVFPVPDSHTMAQISTGALLKFYKQDIGLFQNYDQWWTSANSITTLADFASIATNHDRVWKNIGKIQNNTFTSARHLAANFINPWYDDEGWWALAWIQVYRNTNDTVYLNMAETIFNDMITGISDQCGGGLYWDRQGHYISAISNELFISIAASLANLIPSKKQYYTNHAITRTEWLLGTGLINTNGTIMDGFDAATCTIVPDVWSYNQGVILEGLIELAKATGNASYLTQADELAGSAISFLAPEGVLMEFCDPECAGDGNHQMFKGIFMRNLAKLVMANTTSREQFRTFILENAHTVWTQARTPSGQFNPLWKAEKTNLTATYQSTQAGVDALVAAAMVS